MVHVKFPSVKLLTPTPPPNILHPSHYRNLSPFGTCNVSSRHTMRHMLNPLQKALCQSARTMASSMAPMPPPQPPPGGSGRRPPADRPDWAADEDEVAHCKRCNRNKPIWQFIGRRKDRQRTLICLDCREASSEIVSLYSNRK